MDSFRFTNDPAADPLVDITNVTPGQVEERVRVDRKLFEQLIGSKYRPSGVEERVRSRPRATTPVTSHVGDVDPEQADKYFQHVMRSTNTEIVWPPRLRPNARSKKDPHLRIIGTPENVARAKESISTDLDTRRLRITLKMDVSFTDHSHIIGERQRASRRTGLNSVLSRRQRRPIDPGRDERHRLPHTLP